MGTDQRAQVWAKTDGDCWYCGKKMNPFEDFTEDHMDPRCQGGGDEMENLPPACKRCNSRKNGKTVEEYRTYLAGGGELRFWGELPRSEDEDSDQGDKITPDEYNRIVRECIYFGSGARANLHILLITFTQMVYSWSRYPDRVSMNDLKGTGFFTLEKLSSILGMSKNELFLSILYLNQLGIITSPHWHSGPELAFNFHPLALQKAVKAMSKV